MDATADKDVATRSNSSESTVPLPDDVAACHAVIAQLLEQLRDVRRENSHIQHQLEQLLRRLYGRSSEKLDPNQQSLFAGILDALQPPAPPTPAPEPALMTTVARPAVKTPHGRRRFPADLPRRRIEHDLPEDQKPCPCCGNPRHKIGEEVTEKLEYIPAKVIVLQHVQFKYACEQCESEANNPQIVLAEKPPEAIEKSMAGPGLLACVIVGKYSDHLPLHRLEKILGRHDIDIARSTMCDWAAGCARALRPLYDLMVAMVLASKVIHTDDTPVDVLDKNRQNTRTGRFWIYLGDREHRYNVFDYTPTRSRDGPMQFLAGWGRDRKVYLQADAFSGYNGIYTAPPTSAIAGSDAPIVNALMPPADEQAVIPATPPSENGAIAVPAAPTPTAARKQREHAASLATNVMLAAVTALINGVIEVACWAHARRKFYEARNSDPARSAQALAYIRLLYDVEDQARKEQLNSTRRAALRQELALPRLNQFKAWLQTEQLINGGVVLPKSPMGEAITYALNQWDALCVYVADGDLAIDNNAGENALRRIALGRKNWLFCGSDAGGKTAAILFSFIATCERHKVNPFEYLRDVLARIPSEPMSKLAELLPDQWKTAAATRAASGE
jgi:transposase